MTNSISIKGTREGLTITMGAGDLTALMADLAQHLQSQGAFFRGGRVALELGDRMMESDELAQIDDLLQQHDMILRTVVTTHPTTQRASQKLGLRLVAPEHEAALAPAAESGASPSARATPVAEGRTVLRPQPSPGPHPLDGSKGVLVRHVVRSGQVVRHTGHVVIIGDVNTGAEVIAGADILVWGRLQGTAHAGAMGNDSAVVCALELNPMLLRIADVVARPEDNARKGSYPEVAYVRDRMIVVAPWDGTPRGV